MAEPSASRPDRGADLIVCDARTLSRADLATVDALARLTLAARRLGHQVVLRDASPGLLELLALAGLIDVVPCLPELPGKPRG